VQIEAARFRQKFDPGLRYAGSPVIIDGRANEVDATVLQFGHHGAPLALFE
jgi:hypothetical protein